MHLCPVSHWSLRPQKIIGYINSLSPRRPDNVPMRNHIIKLRSASTHYGLSNTQLSHIYGVCARGKLKERQWKLAECASKELSLDNGSRQGRQNKYSSSGTSEKNPRTLRLLWQTKINARRQQGETQLPLSGGREIARLMCRGWKLRGKEENALLEICKCLYRAFLRKHVYVPRFDQSYSIFWLLINL